MMRPKLPQSNFNIKSVNEEYYEYNWMAFHHNGLLLGVTDALGLHLDTQSEGFILERVHFIHLMLWR